MRWRRGVARRNDYISSFFFSSRRRHTRFDCDWSSDVCSSDLMRSRSVGATYCGSGASTRTSAVTSSGRSTGGACAGGGSSVAAASDGHSSIPTSEQAGARRCWLRSEEHTSELQSQSNLVCRLLLEKK